MRRARRREQHDRGRFRIDGVAELHQRQVVDARALQRDAAGQPRRLDLDAGRGGDRGVAADDGRGWRPAGRRGVVADGAEPGCGVVGPGVAPGCGVGLAELGSGSGFCARCCSICGMLKKYCQPISTRPDRMTARMVLRLSVIVQVSSFNSDGFAAAAARARSQRRTEIVEHGREVAGQRGTAADQHIITVRPH